MSNSSPMFDATVVYIYSDLPTYSRAKKTLVILREMFREVHFIGITRNKSWGEEWPEGIHYHVKEEMLKSGFAGALGVLSFMRYIKRQLREIQPDVVVAVNEDYMLPFSVGYFKKPPVLVQELYDAIFSRIWRGGKPLHYILRVLSTIALLRADALIEVHESKLKLHWYKPDKVIVLHNAPPQVAELQPMTDLPVKDFIYVGGVLTDWRQGVDVLLKAIEKVPGVDILVAGKATGDWIEGTFLKHPRVHYIGVRPYEEVPRLVAASRAVFAHYAPIRLNHIYGASNKIYEAMMVGTPILMNRENLLSREPEQLGYALVSPYGDVDALAENLRVLRDNPDQFEDGCARARERFKSEYAWDVVAPERYSALFRQLGVKNAGG